MKILKVAQNEEEDIKGCTKEEEVLKVAQNEEEDIKGCTKRRY